MLDIYCPRRADNINAMVLLLILQEHQVLFVLYLYFSSKRSCPICPEWVQPSVLVGYSHVAACRWVAVCVGASFVLFQSI